VTTFEEHFNGPPRIFPLFRIEVVKRKIEPTLSAFTAVGGAAQSVLCERPEMVFPLIVSLGNEGRLPDCEKDVTPPVPAPYSSGRTVNGWIIVPIVGLKLDQVCAERLEVVRLEPFQVLSFDIRPATRTQ
jgi:hypothetical protein